MGNASIAIRRGLTLSIGLVACLGGGPAAAGDLVGGRGLAMGGALRAAPSGEAAILLNPAGMSLARAYQVNAIYQYRGSDSSSLAHVSVVDSLTSKLAAGLFYTFAYATPQQTLALGGGQVFELDETLSTHEVGLALGYPLASMFHLGLLAKYVRMGIEQPEDTPEVVKADDIQGLTMDLGVVFNPFSTLNLAVTGQNIVGVDPRFYPRLLGMGISYALGTRFLAEFDTSLNFSSAEKVKASYHVGGELFLAGTYALRGGYAYDSLREASYVSGGFGLVSSKVGFDFGLRQMVQGGAETTIACALRLFLN